MFSPIPRTLTHYYSAVTLARRNGASAVSAAREVLRARSLFGIGPFYYSVLNLHASPESSWGEYILDQEANSISKQVNRPENLPLANDKISFHNHCIASRIPSTPIVAIIAVDRTYVSNIRIERTPIIFDPASLDQMLEDAPDHLFFKHSDGAHGHGAFTATRIGTLWTFDGRRGTALDLYQYCMRRSSGAAAWIIQPKMLPHVGLRDIMPNDALGTVRAITYLSESGPKMILPVLKIPANGNLTDNFSEGMAGNIVAPIDIGSGEVGYGRVSRSKKWPTMVKIEEHPDTGMRIQGKRIPDWPQIVDLILSAQRLTPTLKTVGWDVAITDSGPKVIEANAGYGVVLHQVAYSRGIRSDLQPITSMCPA